MVLTKKRIFVQKLEEGKGVSHAAPCSLQAQTKFCSHGLCCPHGLYPARPFCPWNPPGNNTRLGSHSLFQEIFPTQGSNPSLLHCSQILYHLSHQGSQEYWGGMPFPSPGGLPDPGIEPRSPALQADSLPSAPNGTPHIIITPDHNCTHSARPQASQGQELYLIPIVVST